MTPETSKMMMNKKIILSQNRSYRIEKLASIVTVTAVTIQECEYHHTLLWSHEKNIRRYSKTNDNKSVLFFSEDDTLLSIGEYFYHNTFLNITEEKK